jgi:hypothetical protein
MRSSCFGAQGMRGVRERAGVGRSGRAPADVRGHENFNHGCLHNCLSALASSCAIEAPYVYRPSVPAVAIRRATPRASTGFPQSGRMARFACSPSGSSACSPHRTAPSSPRCAFRSS